MEIFTTKYDTCDIVKAQGRIDSLTSPRLAEIIKSITDDGRFNIVLDMEHVNYLSSAGLRVLIDVQKRCRREKQGELVLVKVPQRIFETLDLAGFVHLFKFFDDINVAVNSFQ